MDDYLKKLKMVAKIEHFSSSTLPRVSQLIQRTNQFNARTLRYSETYIEQISKNLNYFTFALSLKDKFGSNGIVCCLILKK